MQTNDGPKTEDMVDENGILKQWKESNFIFVSSFQELEVVINVLKKNSIYLAGLYFGYDTGGYMIANID